MVHAALRASSTLVGHVQPGIGAVDRAHRGYIEEKVRKDFSDSLEIDRNLRDGRESDPRWDYLLGHAPSGCVVGLEPHSADQDKQVKTVIKKRQYALEQLREHLRPGSAVRAWYWVASGRVDFTSIDKVSLQLSSAGITFVGKQLLAKELEKLAKPQANSPGTKRK